MRVTAQFSDGLMRQLDGRAIGDEFTITALARIVGAEEVLIDITAVGERDARALGTLTIAPPVGMAERTHVPVQPVLVIAKLTAGLAALTRLSTARERRLPCLRRIVKPRLIS
jgi:hypothetical protein